MDEETATPLEAPVETPAAETSPGEDALAKFLAEDGTPSEQPEEGGEAEEAPATEGEAQEAESQSEELPPVYKVKVRGEEIEVGLPELLNGYSRTEDYKAKTAEVAELRKAAATEYADKLEQQVRLFATVDPILAQTQNLDWAALAAQDPATYVSIKAQYDQRIEMIRAAAGEIEQIRGEETARETEALNDYRKHEQEALISAIPDLAAPEKLKSFVVDNAEYLRSNGFAEDDIRSTDDHRAWLIADKARKWDALQNAKVTVGSKKTAQPAQQTLKPRAAESPRAPKRPGPQANDDTRRAWVLAQL